MLASNVRWWTGRGQATGQGQAIAPTMDALRRPLREQRTGRGQATGQGQAIAPTMDALRQHSRGDGLSSPSFAGRFISFLLLKLALLSI